MRIVIDTNVVISGTFFGGYPRKVIEAAVKSDVKACASVDIVQEYRETVDEMIAKGQGKLDRKVLNLLMLALEMVEPQKKIKASRDGDDDMFIDCAKEAKALFIVSGDKDLLVLGEYEGIEIVTAREFCERYL